MSKTFYLPFVLVLSSVVSAQNIINKDSIRQTWTSGFKKIIKLKALTDTTAEAFAFDKRSHKLLVAMSYTRDPNSAPIINNVHFYFRNDTLLWFKVMIQYPPGKKEKGYVEYYYLAGRLIQKLEKGKVIRDYSYLYPQSSIILNSGYELLKSKR